MPRAKRDRQFLVILQLFLDESGYGQTEPWEAFVFAGFFGSVRAWKHFADKWDVLLKEPPVLTAKGFKNLLRRKRNSDRVLKFVRLLEQRGLYRISVCIPRAHYEKAVLAELPKWRRLGLTEDAIWLIRNEYYFGFFCIVESLLVPMVELPIDKATKLEVIYDLNVHEREKLKAGYEEFVNSVPEDADRLNGEPHGETDEDFMPLQAADLYSWHLHRDYVETQQGREHKDSVWDALKALSTYPPLVLSEADLRGMARWDALEGLLRERKIQDGKLA